MKKIKFDRKLSLNKETIARLNDGQMGNVKGGVDLTASCAITACVRCPERTLTDHCTGTDLTYPCPWLTKAVCP